MYSLKVEEDDYAIKPMSCPGGMLVYKLEPRSYKELPMRMGELGEMSLEQLVGLVKRGANV